MVECLPKSRRILERPHMLFRPFGKEPNGEPIRDLSGVSIRANVEYLEEAISQIHGPDSGKGAVEELVARLNETHSRSRLSCDHGIPKKSMDRLLK